MKRLIIVLVLLMSVSFTSIPNDYENKFQGNYLFDIVPDPDVLISFRIDSISTNNVFYTSHMSYKESQVLSDYFVEVVHHLFKVGPQKSSPAKSKLETQKF